ncbi:hypothetical protein MWU58_00580 [Flavobacteriaceae bacterium S0825]|uniref:hypothetical protein n=1 Tax=Gaetbulibacter sp. S0825 TaxID=2720084 RepID=UPI001431FC8B|nr:hypothetical protein [Gaetbulibacter sp. S0825]MCK0107775.1 hypothetical protein [Flavobacteriaceae bacterium S0825]NIX63411.1 hypothetical protein [Gaetbulibacter sp. S0825]
MRRYFLMAFLIFSIGCESNKVNRRVVQMDDVIHKMKENNSNYESWFRYKTPTNINENEIRSVDSLLLEEVEQFNTKQKESERTMDDLIHIEKYQCNYIPVLNEQGEKIIYVISKRVNDNSTWWEVYEILGIRDGYISVFKFSLNLSEKKGGKIMPNGEA